MMSIVTADEIRELFSRSLCAMYQKEMPQSRVLLELIADVNLAVLENNPALHEQLLNADELARISVERHGKIYVATAQELATLGRGMRVMGMYPVGYYDGALSGELFHSTIFRAVDDGALCRNPLRISVSLLRSEEIKNAALRRKVTALLAKRPATALRQRLDRFDNKPGLTAQEAQLFVQEMLAALCLRARAVPDEVTYRALRNEHELLADVVCRQGYYFCHMALRTLDVDRALALMTQYGIIPQVLIDGPPRREFPVLLRRSCLRTGNGTGHSEAMNIAQFGEIEQRGVALTSAGQALCQRLLRAAGTGRDNLTHQLRLQNVFSAFPDSDTLLRRQGLAWFRYRLTPAGEVHRHAIQPGDDPQTLIERGWLIAQPIVYEDGLLADEGTKRGRSVFEQALGEPVLDAFALYQQAEEHSKRRCGLL